MPLPQQVTDQAKNSDDIISKLNGTHEAIVNQDGTLPAAHPQNTDTPAEGAPGTVDEGQPQVLKPDLIPQKKPEQPKPEYVPKADYDLLTQQFSSLKGRVEKSGTEQTLLFNQNKDLINQLTEARSEISLLEERLKSKPTDPESEPNAAPANNMLDPEAFGKFGVEFQQMAEVLNGLTDKIKTGQAPAPAGQPNGDPQPKEPTKTTEQEMDALFNSYYSQVSVKVSTSFQKDLDAINIHPVFTTWLKSEDGMTGLKREVILDHASKELNVENAFRVISSFLSDNPNFDTATPQKPAPVLPNVQPPAQDGQPSDAAPQATSDMKWDSNSINAFYDDVKRGKFKNDPEKKKALEEDLFKADSEGRMLYSKKA